MIVEAILTAIVAVAMAVFELLPDADPLDLTEFSGIWYGYSFLNGFLPITELMVCVGAMLAFHVALYAAAGVVYVWRLLPFKFS